MEILLVAATIKEAEAIWNITDSDLQLNKGTNKARYKDLEISLLITGVGLMHTAYQMGDILAKERFQFAINFGIAGSFKEELQLGETVQVIEDRVADAGTEDNDNFIDLIEMKLMDPNEFPYEDGKLQNKGLFNLPILKKVKKANGISLNKALGNQRSIDLIKKKYQPDIESLEGAAFFYSCFQNDLPCLQLRSVSNYVKPRNKEDWKIDLALKNITEVMATVLDEINDTYKISP